MGIICVSQVRRLKDREDKTLWDHLWGECGNDRSPDLKNGNDGGGVCLPLNKVRQMFHFVISEPHLLQVRSRESFFFKPRVM